MSDLERFREAQEERLGRVVRHDLGVVDARTIRRYAMAIGDLSPVFHDRDAARAAGFADIVAPPNLLSAIVDWGAGRAEEELSADGTGRAASNGLRLMGAGEEIELVAPVVAGTTIWAEEEVVKVEAKTGRSGPLLFITTRHDFFDDEGRPLNRNRRTVMVRP